MRARTRARIGTRARAAVGLLLLGCAGCLGAQSLKETIGLALAHDSGIASAAQDVQASTLEADSAVRNVLPSLSLGGSYQYVSSVPSVTIPTARGPETLSLQQSNNYDFSAGFKWTPFTGFAQEAGIQQKRLQARLAANGLESTRTQVALNTITAFRQAQAARLQLDILDSAADRAQLQLDQARTLERQGMARKVDIVSLSIARLDFDRRLIGAKADLANALEQLKTLTGKDIAVPPPPETLSDRPLPDLKEDDLLQLKAMSIQRGIFQSAGALARSRYYPVVAVSGAVHYGQPGVNPIENEWMTYGTLGVAVSWAWNWGGDILEAQAADHRILKLKSDETATREQAELAYHSAVRDWSAARDELEVLRASLDLSRNKMQIVKTQYDQGMATTTDFNDANLELAQAELQFRSQILSILLAGSRIDALSGEPPETWSVAQ